MRPPLKGLVAPGIATLIALAVLIFLGTWQLQRLAWKENLISHIAARAHGPALTLPDEAAWRTLTPDDYDYRHVSATGTFEHAREVLVFRGSSDGKAGAEGPGFLVLTPLRLSNGAHVVVNRGFVPLALKDPARRLPGQISGPVTVTGLMRPPESRNSFTPPDDPAKGVWYTRDPALIAAHFKLERPAPFSIDADTTPVPGGWPRGGASVLNVPNNHLSYAFTWYGLALALAGVFGVFAWRKLHPAKE